METKDRKLIDTLCLDCCNTLVRKCQRYPGLSETCNDFFPLLKAYKAGIQEAVEWIDKNRLELYWKTISTTGHDYYIPLILADTWQAQKKEWGV